MALNPEIPKFSFGTAARVGEDVTALMTNKDFRDLLEKALRTGCRHVDCAPIYNNQPLVGRVLQRVTESIPRNDFFITSKIPPNMLQPEHIERSITNTLNDLKLTYLDCFLIHAPFATQYIDDDTPYPLDQDGNLLLDQTENILETAWRVLADFQSKGFCSYIGLSNVNEEQIARLHKIRSVDIVQNEYHLFHQGKEMIDFCDELNIHFEAYATFGKPLAARSLSMPNILDHPVVNQIAMNHQMCPAQVIVQWICTQPVSYVMGFDNFGQFEETFAVSNRRILTNEELRALDEVENEGEFHMFKFEEYGGIRNHREYPFSERPMMNMTEHTFADGVLPQMWGPTDQPRTPPSRRPFMRPVRPLL